jgi:glycosyltransferase involved in cell wall biosynthesis
MAPRLECFIPAYNESADLAANVERLLAFCKERVDGGFQITIVDNGSSDATGRIADALGAAHAEIAALHYPERGRGRALRRAFLGSEARLLGYMDADLSTHLRALPEALARLEAGADVVIGSRLIPGAHTTRRLHREVLSRSYNALVRRLFGSRLRDHQCGFKFLSRETCLDLVPRTEDDFWFFDTELLVLAVRAGRRIDEIPVDWIEDLGSTVRIVRTIFDDLRGMQRLRRRLGEPPTGSAAIERRP